MNAGQRPMVQVVLTVVGTVGLVDALAGATWDLAVLFAAVTVLSVLLVVRAWARSNQVAVRGDLASWLATRAAVGGESVDSVADRALSAYRAGVTADPSPPAGP